VHALREGGAHHRVHVVGDGEAALAFLHRRGPYTTAPRPDLILLDLNLPRIAGRDVLATIKADERLRGIPVIILTTSSTDTDILRASVLGHGSAKWPNAVAKACQIIRLSTPLQRHRSRG